MSRLRNKLNSAAEAIALRLAEITARNAGGVAAGVAVGLAFVVTVGGSAGVERVDGKTEIGCFMMCVLMVLRG
mgnify:FL=1